MESVQVSGCPEDSCCLSPPVPQAQKVVCPCLSWCTRLGPGSGPLSVWPAPGTRRVCRPCLPHRLGGCRTPGSFKAGVLRGRCAGPQQEETASPVHCVRGSTAGPEVELHLPFPSLWGGDQQGSPPALTQKEGMERPRRAFRPDRPHRPGARCHVEAAAPACFALRCARPATTGAAGAQHLSRATCVLPSTESLTSRVLKSTSDTVRTSRD